MAKPTVGLNYGDGSGDGYGYGSGYGYGDGSGDGYGDGYGSGSGSGSGYGSGYGYGDGSGDGSGDGYGYGYGSGYGDGYGDGDGSVFIVSKKHAWKAYHYIARKDKETFITRSGQEITIGTKLHEKKISMCQRGLHASLSHKDARKYAPRNSVLTEVLVWGRIQLRSDKLVATHRKLIGIAER